MAGFRRGMDATQRLPRGNQREGYADTNGKFVTFASLIQIPKGVQRIPEGMEIAVADEPLEPSQLLNQETMEEAKISGIIRISGVCLKFDKGRLHCRLWV